MTKPKITRRSDFPEMVFQSYLSLPGKPVIAVQLGQAESVKHPFASAGGFQGVTASWKITYGKRPDGSMDIAICQNDIFQLSYEHLGGNTYQKKTDIITEAIRIDEPLDILTLEGPSHAEQGDWMLVGNDGDLHFCANDVFVARYEPAD